MGTPCARDRVAESNVGRDDGIIKAEARHCKFGLHDKL